MRWTGPLLGVALLLFLVVVPNSSSFAQASPERRPHTPPALACAHVGSGRLFDVGPGLAFASVGEVPWEDLGAGDTVRIHWRAAPYHEKILIRAQGTAEQPITICGVAGPQGELPIIDGQDATTRPSMGYRVAGTEARGLIHVSWGAGDDWGYKPRHIVIQGLHVRNAYHQHSFTRSDGQVAEYANNASGIFIERGEQITVRGVLVTDNGNGFFVASGDSEEVLSRNIVLERSSLYGNGTVAVAFDRHHNVYTEAVGMLFQFNYLGPLRPGSGGSALKDRSAGTVLRYNWVEGGARTLDLVEAEESWAMVAELPEYHTTFVYGNVLVNGPGGATNMVHYGGDSGVFDTYRKGTLFFYHNTVVIRSDQSERWRVVLLEVATNDESVDARNNIVYLRPQTPGAEPSFLSWMHSAGALSLGVNWGTPGTYQWRDGVEPVGSVTGMERVLTDAGNDPGWVDEAAGNFLLRPGSPAIDTGEELHPFPRSLGFTVDFEYSHPASGVARTAAGAPDLGAFANAGNAR